MKEKSVEILVTIIVATFIHFVELSYVRPFSRLPEQFGAQTQGVSIVTRIINGEFAVDAQFPYISYLVAHGKLNCTSKDLHCAANIIAKNWLLTAGHCVTKDIDATFIFEIQAGEIIVNQPRQRKITLAAQAFAHPQYDPGTLENDIALIKVYPSFYFGTPYVKPIALPAANTNKASYVGQSFTVAGWGYISNDGPVSPELRYTNLTVIDFDECYNIYQGGSPNSSFCAQDVIDKSTSCLGDSGGAAVLSINGILTVIGVVSFSFYTGCDTGPVGYTDVSLYVDWIQEMMKKC